MKRRLMLTLGIVLTMGLSSTLYAESAGTNCDTNPAMPKGSAGWRSCYINSSVAMCEAGQTYLGRKPNCGSGATCDPSCLGQAMARSYGMRSTICGYEAGEQWLPAGVTVASCEADWGCYIGRSCS